MNEYRGITYPKIFRFGFMLRLWRWFNCRRNMHLFDEVESGDEHYLYCDACGKLYVFIDRIEIDEDCNE